jgi:hypothetical protein
MALESISPPIAVLGIALLALLVPYSRNHAAHPQVAEGDRILIGTPWVEPRQFLLNSEIAEQAAVQEELSKAAGQSFTRNAVDLERTLQSLTVSVSTETGAGSQPASETKKEPESLLGKIFDLAPEERLTRLIQYRQMLENYRSSEKLPALLASGYTLEKIKFPVTLIYPDDAQDKVGLLHVYLDSSGVKQDAQFAQDLYVKILSSVAWRLNKDIYKKDDLAISGYDEEKDPSQFAVTQMVAKQIFWPNEFKLPGSPGSKVFIHVPYGKIEDADKPYVQEIISSDEAINHHIGAFIAISSRVINLIDQAKAVDASAANKARVDFARLLFKAPGNCDLASVSVDKFLTDARQITKPLEEKLLKAGIQPFGGDPAVKDGLAKEMSAPNLFANEMLAQRLEAPGPMDLRRYAILSFFHSDYLEAILQSLAVSGPLDEKARDPLRQAILNLAYMRGVAADLAGNIVWWRKDLSDPKNPEENWDTCSDQKEEVWAERSHVKLVPSAIADALDRMAIDRAQIMNVDAGGAGISSANETGSSNSAGGDLAMGHGALHLSSSYRSGRDRDTAGGITDATMVPVFMGGLHDGKPGAASGMEHVADFGWIVPHSIVTSRRSAVEPVTAAVEVGVPAFWRGVRLRIDARWVSKNALRDELTKASFGASGQNRGEDASDSVGAVYTTFLPLKRSPADWDVIVDYILDQLDASMGVGIGLRAVEPQEISTCLKTVQITVEGTSVWKSPQVYLNGRQATSIGISPDLRRLELTFGPDRNPYSLTQATVPLTIASPAGSVTRNITLKHDDCEPGSSVSATPTPATKPPPSVNPAVSH